MKLASLAVLIPFLLGIAGTAAATTRIDQFLKLSEDQVALITGSPAASSASQKALHHDLMREAADVSRVPSHSTDLAEAGSQPREGQEPGGILPAPLRNMAFNIDTEDKDGPAFTVFFNYGW